MVVDGLWDLGFHLNLTRDTICDTWLFIQSMGRQPCLPGPNSPISHSFPSFLVCISEISSSSYGTLWLQPPSLSLSPSYSLVLHSSTLSCHPPVLHPHTDFFFRTDLILTGLGKLLLEPEHSLKSTPTGAMGQPCVQQRKAWIMTQSWVRNQGLRWRQGLETGSKSKANGREQRRSVWEMAERLVTWACQHPCLLVMFLPHSAWGPQLGPGKSFEEETKPEQTRW